MGNILSRIPDPFLQGLAAFLAVGFAFIFAQSGQKLQYEYLKWEENSHVPTGEVLDESIVSTIPTNCFDIDLATGHAWKVYVNGTRLCAIKETEGWSSVRAMKPYPPFAFERRLFYFEVPIIDKRGWMNIGLAADDFPLSDYFVGTHFWSFAISNWGNLFVDGKEVWGYSQHLPSNKSKGSFFREGSVVGCGLLDLPDRGRHLFFTRQGQLFGMPIPLTAQQASRALYPTVSAMKTASIEANFGGNLADNHFLFDTTNLVELIRRASG